MRTLPGNSNMQQITTQRSPLAFIVPDSRDVDIYADAMKLLASPGEVARQRLDVLDNNVFSFR